MFNYIEYNFNEFKSHFSTNSNHIKNIKLFSITDSTEAVKCYRCTVAPIFRTENRTQQLCSKFRESDEFVVDCPYSTMCMKKVFRYQLQDGTNIETVNRNCADQKFTEQVVIFSVLQKLFLNLKYIR